MNYLVIPATDIVYTPLTESVSLDNGFDTLFVKKMMNLCDRLCSRERLTCSEDNMVSEADVWSCYLQNVMTSTESLIPIPSGIISSIINLSLRHGFFFWVPGKTLLSDLD